MAGLDHMELCLGSKLCVLNYRAEHECDIWAPGPRLILGEVRGWSDQSEASIRRNGIVK